MGKGRLVKYLVGVSYLLSRAFSRIQYASIPAQI